MTFSKEMADKSWSWSSDTGRGATLPSGENKPFYDKDKKTNGLPVKLEPETTYAVWINGGKFNSFVDADKNRSLPYLLVFRTGKAKECRRSGAIPSPLGRRIGSPRCRRLLLNERAGITPAGSYFLSQGFGPERRSPAQDRPPRQLGFHPA